MKVYVNNKEKQLLENTTIEDLIKDIELNKWISVWVNDVQLLEGEYSNYLLKDNDHIKIIRILAGG